MDHRHVIPGPQSMPEALTDIDPLLLFQVRMAPLQTAHVNRLHHLHGAYMRKGLCALGSDRDAGCQNTRITSRSLPAQMPLAAVQALQQLDRLEDGDNEALRFPLSASDLREHPDHIGLPATVIDCVFNTAVVDVFALSAGPCLSCSLCVCGAHMVWSLRPSRWPIQFVSLGSVFGSLHVLFRGRDFH
jgi:hypothetical protein